MIRQPRLGDWIEGRYRLDDELGGGGFATVYRAHDAKLGIDVAVKVLDAHKSASPSFVARFEREVRVVTRLRHPNTIRVTDFGKTDEGCLFLTMELVHGVTLDDLLEENPQGIDQDRAVAITIQVLRALVEAHRHQIVHRDLKPANIMLSRHEDGLEHVKVLDFGVAKALATDDEPSVTQTGAIIGTPQYAAPEQLSGTFATLQSDLYSAGLVLYEMLVGVPAVQGQNLLDTVRIVAEKTPVRLPASIADVRLRQVLQRMLAKTLDERYSAAEQALVDLQALGLGDSLVPTEPVSPRASQVQRYESGRGRATPAPSGSGHRRPATLPDPVPVPFQLPPPTPLPPASSQTVEPLPRRRRAAWVAAAMLVCAVVVGGLALSGGSDADPADTPTAAANPVQVGGEQGTSGVPAAGRAMQSGADSAHLTIEAAPTLDEARSRVAASVGASWDRVAIAEVALQDGAAEARASEGRAADEPEETRPSRSRSRRSSRRESTPEPAREPGAPAVVASSDQEPADTEGADATGQGEPVPSQPVLVPVPSVREVVGQGSTGPTLNPVPSVRERSGDAQSQ